MKPLLLSSQLMLLLTACTGEVSDGGSPRDAGATSGDTGTMNRGDGGMGPRDAGAGIDTGSPCTPTTCAAGGAACGSLPDGCGGTLSCGGCTGEEVCGGDGTPNQCAVPPDCGPPPAGVTPEQAESLRVVNELRTTIGVPCATMIPEINQAAQGHADYGALNRGDATCRSGGHDQTMGCPGFTGTSFSQRLSAAGYSGGRSEIAHFIGNPQGAVSGWVGTLWHRIPIVHPNTDHFGAGHAERFDVMDFGRTQAADRTGTWFYPYDGQSVAGQGGDETPSPPAPPAGCSTWGTFVTIMFSQGATVSIDTHELIGPSGAETHEWVTPSGSPFLAGSVYAMVPCPLESGSYTVRVTGTLEGAPLDRSSTFTVR